ncbi:MAG TPA: SDR family oxidoreductase [Acidimicrobiia bacterium]|nr:SDR family oxidoreductase [Acidimicrobiia bacterium]
MKSELTGSTALITGAGRGLGRAIARQLAEMGAAVAAADIDGESAKETAGMVEELGPPAMAVEMDVSDEESVAAGVERVEREMGGFDILVNNAGIDRTVPIVELEPDQWRAVMGVNLDGPFYLCRHAFTLLAERHQSGHIVNVVSTAAKRAWANASAYHASKWGLLGLSHALHVEGRELGIGVTAVVAGGMRTPFILDRFPDVDVDTLQDPAGVARAVGFALTCPPGTVIPELMVIPTHESSWP